MWAASHFVPGISPAKLAEKYPGEFELPEKLFSESANQCHPTGLCCFPFSDKQANIFAAVGFRGWREGINERFSWTSKSSRWGQGSQEAVEWQAWCSHSMAEWGLPACLPWWQSATGWPPSCHTWWQETFCPTSNSLGTQKGLPVVSQSITEGCHSWCKPEGLASRPSGRSRRFRALAQDLIP